MAQEPLAGSGSARMVSMPKVPAFTVTKLETTSTVTTSNRFAYALTLYIVQYCLCIFHFNTGYDNDLIPMWDFFLFFFITVFQLYGNVGCGGHL